MASISSAGIGSGLDVQGLVTKLVAAEGDPVTNRLNTKETMLQAELSAIGTLKGALSTFQSSVSGLTILNTFGQRTATSGNTNLFTATASSTAGVGNYQVEVQQLATSQTLTSSAFTDSSAAIGTGTLTFQFGDPTKAAQSVTITDANNSLLGIRDAVNAANIGVRASVVNGDAGYQLVFSSTNPGTDNSLKISVSENPAAGTNTDMTGLSQLAYDPTAAVGNGKNLTEQTAAQDAVVVIDGVTVTRSSNTISDAVNGVTFSLIGAAVGTKTTLSVAADTSSVASAINNFVSGYNSLVGVFNSLGGYDATTQKGGILLGDSALLSVTSQLRTVMGNVVAGLGGSYRALADIGITTQADGTLALDQTKLDNALSSNPDDVTRLFAAVGQPTDTSITFGGSTSATKAGTYGVNITQLATKGQYVDTASSLSNPAGPVVDSTNDTLSVKVDGIQSGTISLTQKTYGSAADLAAELQSRINGDSALQAAGVAVTVAYDSVNNRFTFTSNRYGSASSVAITAVKDVTASGTIGLTASGTAATQGLDVAGTIGGATATGNGQYLTGIGNAAGLQIQVTGTTTGYRGDVVFSRGVADQLNTLLTSMVASNGALSNRTDTLNKQIADIGDQRTALATRLNALQQRYLAQFTALDSLISQMQSTSTFLTNQLAALPGASSGSSKSG